MHLFTLNRTANILKLISRDVRVIKKKRRKEERKEIDVFSFRLLFFFSRTILEF